MILDKNNSFNFNNPETFLDCARFGSISASFFMDFVAPWDVKMNFMRY